MRWPLLLIVLCGTLSCQPPLPDFRLVLSQEVFPITAGESVTGRVGVTWTQGDPQPVDFTFRNLPPGISVTEGFRLSAGDERSFTFTAGPEVVEGVHIVPLVGRAETFLKYAVLRVAVRGTSGALDQSFQGGMVTLCGEGDTEAAGMAVESANDLRPDGTLQVRSRVIVFGRSGRRPAALFVDDDGRPDRALLGSEVEPRSGVLEVRGGVFDPVWQRVVLAGGAGGARLWALRLEDGTPDVAFGEGGTAVGSLRVAVGIGQRASAGPARFLVAGEAGMGDVGLEAFSAEGQPVSLADGGVFTSNDSVEAPGVMRVVKGGGVLVGGATESSSGASAMVQLFSPEGAVETAFGAGGMLALPVGDSAARVTSLAQDAQDRLLAAGAGARAFVARFNALGRLDATFGAGGVLVLDEVQVGTPAILATTPEGLWLATTSTDAAGLGDVRLQRLQQDGSPDARFAQSGSVVLTDEVDSEAVALEVQADGRILVQSNVRLGAIRCAALSRLWD